MDIINSFINDTAKQLRHLGVELENKKIVVALSGGADSVSLLYALSRLTGEMRYEIYALHVNHGIRGEEAFRDQTFCAELCAKLNIPLKIVSADIPALAAENKQSLELCGREFRYSVLESYCDDNNIDYIATAHNANDNAETVLYNLIRGCGLDGLKGIPTVRGRVIRPILHMERSRIVAFLDAVGQVYVTDSTNGDSAYTRNYIRNFILPACLRINGSVISAVNRTSNVLKEDSAVLDALANEAYENGDALISLPLPIQARVLRLMFSEVSSAELEQCHIAALQSALMANGCKHISLPGGITAEIFNGTVSFNSVYLPVRDTAVEYGFTDLGNGVTVKMCATENLRGAVRIKLASVSGGIYVRSRREGDRITVRGISKNVKKCFIDKKIPAPMRASVPVFCDEAGIIYIPYIGVCDRVYPSKGDEFLEIAVAFDERFGL